MSSNEWFPIGQIQYPKPRVDFVPNFFPTGRAVQIPLAQLRLTERAEVAIAKVVFDEFNGGGANAQGFRQLQRLDEIEIVRRRVILRKRSPYAAHQATDREIEAWRTVLPLIVPIR